MEKFVAETLIVNVLRDVATPEQRAEFQSRNASDPEFASLVREVRKFLSPLSGPDMSVSSDRPRPELLQSILNQLED